MHVGKYEDGLSSRLGSCKVYFQLNQCSPRECTWVCTVDIIWMRFKSKYVNIVEYILVDII